MRVNQVKDSENFGTCGFESHMRVENSIKDIKKNIERDIVTNFTKCTVIALLSLCKGLGCAYYSSLDVHQGKHLNI